MNLKTIQIASDVALTNAMSALPQGDRARCSAMANPDGTWAVTAPDDLISHLGSDHPTAPLPVPTEISRAQAKIQLRRAGLRDAAEHAVREAGGEVGDWYAEAAMWRRDSPYIAQIAAALNPPLSDESVDDLFRAAAQVAA